MDRVAAVVAGVLALCVACGRDDAAQAHASSAATGPAGPADAAAQRGQSAAAPPGPAAAAPDCGHAVCADNLFVDAVPGGACAAGAICTLRLTLVATGDFHVNEQYPYRFKADDAEGLTFLGIDEAGQNVFSKNAGDWKALDAKSGTMTVKFTPHTRGPATVGGTLKLSVCSGATCQLEQSRLSAAVSVD